MIKAENDLVKAKESHKASKKKMCCIIMLLLMVIGAILIPVLITQLWYWILVIFSKNIRLKIMKRYRAWRLICLLIDWFDFCCFRYAKSFTWHFFRLKVSTQPIDLFFLILYWLEDLNLSQTVASKENFSRSGTYPLVLPFIFAARVAFSALGFIYSGF